MLILPERVFDWKNLAASEAVHYLSCYAKISHFDLLVSHPGGEPESRLERSLFSALVSEVEVPLLVRENPEASAPRKVHKILFPVSDPVRDEEGFLQTVALAQATRSRITLWVRLFDPTHWRYWNWVAFASGLVPYYGGDIEIASEVNAKLAILSKWINRARKSGVEVGIRTPETCQDYWIAAGNFTDELGYDLIAVSPHDAASTTESRNVRKLSDQARCPIWIARPPHGRECEEQLRSVELRLLESRAQAV